MTDLEDALARAELIASGHVQHNWASEVPVHEWYRREIQALVDAVRRSQ